MPGTSPLDAAIRAISALALGDRPGAIVLAEQAVDQHAALFQTAADRLTALKTLAGDLLGVGQSRLELAPFLQRVDDYIGLLQHQLTPDAVATA